MVYPPGSQSPRTSECGLFGTKVSEGYVRTHGGAAPVAPGSERCCVFSSICSLKWSLLGSPGGSVVKNLPAVQETPVQFLGQELNSPPEFSPWVGKIPWRRAW